MILAWDNNKELPRLYEGKYPPTTVFVGEKPSPTGDPDDPLGHSQDSSGGHWLAELMGIDIYDFCSRYGRFNLNYVYGYMGRFDQSEAKLNAQAILYVGMRRGDWAVLLGRKVADIFGLKENLTKEGWLSIHAIADRQLILMPAQSEMDTWWDDWDNAEMAGQVLKQIEKERKEGARRRREVSKTRTFGSEHGRPRTRAFY